MFCRQRVSALDPEVAVRVRAQDGIGVVQTKEEIGTLPDGASGYHLVRLRVST